jgi:hypothetical protein
MFEPPPSARTALAAIDRTVMARSEDATTRRIRSLR